LLLLVLGAHNVDVGVLFSDKGVAEDDKMLMNCWNMYVMQRSLFGLMCRADALFFP
jgi:hypothetical protein